MRAAVRERYGSPDVIEIRELERPEPADDEVLVRVRASSVNPAEWYTVAGRPWVGRAQVGLRKPKNIRLGVDLAGTVEAVGKDVTAFRPGDEVFGGRDGAYADYVCVRESRAIVHKPANVTFEEAAAVPVAALTALQGLRDKGGIQAGQKVLVNGASGGVGTCAVQVAKAFGAEVTAVCSTRNVELVRSLGADRVVDYTREDFTRSDERYDLLLDVAGSRSWRECARVLAPDATVVLVGGSKANRLLGPIGHVAGMKLAALRGNRKAVFFVARFEKADLETLRELLENGKLKPVVERQYELEQIADAFRYLGEGHAQGKLVVALGA
jgi:NADPH:quinone reductase-like Zn-dependent oxidoreductase